MSGQCPLRRQRSAPGTARAVWQLASVAATINGARYLARPLHQEQQAQHSGQSSQARWTAAERASLLGILSARLPAPAALLTGGRCRPQRHGAAAHYPHTKTKSSPHLEVCQHVGSGGGPSEAEEDGARGGAPAQHALSSGGGLLWRERERVAAATGVRGHSDSSEKKGITGLLPGEGERVAAQSKQQWKGRKEGTWLPQARGRAESVS